MASPVLGKIWRRIPEGIRRSAAGRSLEYQARAWVAAGFVRHRRPRPGPVTVAGLLRSAAGLGRGARLTLDAFERLGVPTRTLDLSELYHHGDISLEPGRPTLPGDGGVMMIHVNAPELPFAIQKTGRDLVCDRRIIGNWAWELPRIPRRWRIGFGYVDEVWVHSKFVAAAVAPHANIAVRVVPLPVTRPEPAGRSRADFGLPEDAFVCLTMFDPRSSLARKNPLAAIHAFRQAFENDLGAVLVLKINERPAAATITRAIDAEIAGLSNVRVIRGQLQDDEVAALTALADVVVSLHRSEGFGLVPAEAMLLGTPVVATGWSGNMDFMNDENSALVGYTLVPAQDPQAMYDLADQRWAEPDVEEAAGWLRRLSSDGELRRRLGHAAAQDVARHCGLDAYRKNIGGLERFSQP